MKLLFVLDRTKFAKSLSACNIVLLFAFYCLPKYPSAFYWLSFYRNEPLVPGTFSFLITFHIFLFFMSSAIFSDFFNNFAFYAARSILFTARLYFSYFWQIFTKYSSDLSRIIDFSKNYLIGGFISFVVELARLCRDDCLFIVDPRHSS